jgi:hypothetical protein
MFGYFASFWDVGRLKLFQTIPAPEMVNKMFEFMSQKQEHPWLFDKKKSISLVSEA